MFVGLFSFFFFFLFLSFILPAARVTPRSRFTSGYTAPRMFRFCRFAGSSCGRLVAGITRVRARRSNLGRFTVRWTMRGKERRDSYQIREILKFLLLSPRRRNPREPLTQFSKNLRRALKGPDLFSFPAVISILIFSKFSVGEEARADSRPPSPIFFP